MDRYSDELRRLLEGELSAEHRIHYLQELVDALDAEHENEVFNLEEELAARSPGRGECQLCRAGYVPDDFVPRLATKEISIEVAGKTVKMPVCWVCARHPSDDARRVAWMRLLQKRRK